MIRNYTGHLKPGSEEEDLLRQINLKKVPAHVAVIMDGNGRWAKLKGLPREAGHKEGAKSAKIVTECAVNMGIKFLTVFAFSSENWKRSIREVSTLMNMLYENLVTQKEFLVDNQIRLKILGEMDRLPAKLQQKLHETIEFSKDFKKMQLNMALNYGSRSEILRAIKNMIREKVSAEKVDEKLFRQYLYTNNCPHPDLLIRTSGELRVSNFLLYQIAYSELYFTNILWPDFRKKEFFRAILEYQHRNRRFGRV